MEAIPPTTILTINDRRIYEKLDRLNIHLDLYLIDDNSWWFTGTIPDTGASRHYRKFIGSGGMSPQGIAHIYLRSGRHLDIDRDHPRSLPRMTQRVFEALFRTIAIHPRFEAPRRHNRPPVIRLTAIPSILPGGSKSMADLEVFTPHEGPLPWPVTGLHT